MLSVSLQKCMGKFSSILAYKQNYVDERFHNKRNSGVKKF